MTPKQQALIIQRMVDEQVNKHATDIRKQTAQQVYAVMLRNLHDKHNFTAQQLIEIFEQSVADFECINDKYVDINDFYALLGEMGVNVS